jgi:hypothetical protein
VSITGRLLDACWPDGMPPKLAGLVDHALSDRLIDRYKLGVVFPFEDGARPVRLTLSAQDERARWLDAIEVRWPGAAALLAAVPESVRLVLDSDGSERAELYLDDLQGAIDPQGYAVMCKTFVLNESTTQITRHEAPLAAPPLVGARLSEAGADGRMWGVRWIDERPRSLLWISEARRHKTLAASRSVAERIGEHARYRDALAAVSACGREAYVDGIELWDDGRADVTLGIR